MTNFFERILHDQTGSIRVGDGPEKVVEREDLKGILDKFLGCLSDSLNEKNIDKIMGDNSTVELREDIQITKDILEKTGLLANSHSNGKEILRNIETSFTAFLRKARDKGVENYADIIKKDYDELKMFFDLTLECKEFREKEFGDTGGYLTEEDNAGEGVNLRLDIEKYLKKCEERIRKSNN